MTRQVTDSLHMPVEKSIRKHWGQNFLPGNLTRSEDSLQKGYTRRLADSIPSDIHWPHISYREELGHRPSLISWAIHPRKQ